MTIRRHESPPLRAGNRVRDISIKCSPPSFMNNTSLPCPPSVTAVVIQATDNIDDIKLAYQRAIAADSSNEKILNQFDFYSRACGMKELECEDESHYVYSRSGNLIGLEEELYEEEDRKKLLNGNGIECILCTEDLCEKCKLKNDYRDILEYHRKNHGPSRKSIGVKQDLNSLCELSNILLNVSVDLQED